MDDHPSFCPHCGESMEAADVFCPFCGRRAEPSPSGAQEAAPAPAPDSPPWRVHETPSARAPVPPPFEKPDGDAALLTSIRWSLAWALGAFLHGLVRGSIHFAAFDGLYWMAGGLVAGAGLVGIGAGVRRERAVVLQFATALGWLALLSLGDGFGKVVYVFSPSWVVLEGVRGVVFAGVAGVSGGWIAGRLGAPDGAGRGHARRRAVLGWGAGALVAVLLRFGSTFL